jgi:cell division protein FtsW
VSAGGATRWLRFGGSFGLQPAEFAKLALIVYLATWLGGKREQIGSWRITVPFVLITATVVGLVVAEPDLGTAIVVVVVALAMYFAAGARLREFAALGGLTAVVVLALAVAQPYRLQRLVTFLDPWSDPQKYGFQTIQMLYALGLGGPFGEGLGAGKEKFGYLPHPYTDSIFAVLGDELGLAGALVIVLLFLALVRCSRPASRSGSASRPG